MKKIIIDEDLKALADGESSFLRRADVRVYTVTGNREALAVHRQERADLIVIRVDAPGMNGEIFCALVRAEEELRRVSIIVVGPPGREGSEALARCRANATINDPVPTQRLLDRAHQLLNVSKREAYRVPISVSVQGQVGSRPFLCHSENISMTGMLFKTDRSLAPGDIVSCSFILPDETRVKTDAEIVRVVRSKVEYDTHQYGVSFKSLEEYFMDAIRAFVEASRGR